MMLEGPLPPLDVLNQAAATDCRNVLVVRADATGEVHIHTSEHPEIAISLAAAAYHLLDRLIDREPLTEH